MDTRIVGLVIGQRYDGDGVSAGEDICLCAKNFDDKESAVKWVQENLADSQPDRLGMPNGLCSMWGYVKVEEYCDEDTCWCEVECSDTIIIGSTEMPEFW